MQYEWLPVRSCAGSATDADRVHLRSVSEGQSLHLLGKGHVSHGFTAFFLWCSAIH